ncbi:MAG: hypothetical protein JO237_13790, partial [Pseudolabrys sp.]|nr:hypothetical protein [Pseudolabrys sp.]
MIHSMVVFSDENGAVRAACAVEICALEKSSAPNASAATNRIVPSRGVMQIAGERGPTEADIFAGETRRNHGRRMNWLIRQLTWQGEKAHFSCEMTQNTPPDIPFNKTLDLQPDTVDEPMPGVRRVMAS